MTESEAIEELKYDCNELGKAIPCDTSWGSSFENAYRMAIQALEKQIQKKPIDRCIYKECPTCGNVEIESCKHCPDCGQKLDWSDDNDD